MAELVKPPHPVVSPSVICTFVLKYFSIYILDHVKINHALKSEGFSSSFFPLSSTQLRLKQLLQDEGM